VICGGKAPSSGKDRLDHAYRAQGAEDAARARLRILATTDLHMHILPYDYFTDTPSPTRGLARTASLIHAARSEEEGSGLCLLVDNGDFLTGTPMDDQIAQRLGTSGADPNEPHPMIALMNGLGYDAATLGNHDFDHGFARLEQVLAHAAFPFVLANVDRPPTGRAAPPFLPPHTILTRKIPDQDGTLRTVKIGVTGLLPPQSIRPRRTLKTLPQTEEMVQAARQVVPALRAQGADLVLVLAHTGIGDATDHPGLENALIPLSRVAGIDAIIGGHAHQVFPGPLAVSHASEVNAATGHINGVPVAVPGFWGSHLGVIDLDLAYENGTWSVSSNRVELRPISARDADGRAQATTADDPAITRAIAREHDRTLDYVRTPVGHSARRLHSYFALIAPNAAVQLVQRAQREFAARVLAGTAHADLPLLSSASALKCGGIGGPDHYTDVPAGELTLRAIADLYLYPNDLVVLKASGRMMRDWLERAASVFNQLVPGRPDQPVIEASTPCYLYETVLGLDYKVDLSRPALFTPRGVRISAETGQGRIRDLCHQDQPIREDAEFLLVTNGFRASGGGHYPMLAKAEQVLNAGDCIRDVLNDHLRGQVVADLPPEPHWHLMAPAGSSATLDCSPKALPLIDDLARNGAAPRLAPLNRLTNGFLRYRLNF